MWRLILLFTLVPLAELALLLKLGEATAWWFPVLLVAATGVLGAALARRQGRTVLRDIRGELHAGRMPADALLDGLYVLMGGALLITPGVLTDAVGLCCLLPPTRRRMKRWLKRWLRQQIEAGRFVVSPTLDIHDDDWLPG